MLQFGPQHRLKARAVFVDSQGQKLKIDVYKGTKDPMLRMAVREGSGLPKHVKPKNWILMPPGTSQIVDDAVEDIEARGFCFYKLVLP